MDSEYIDYSYFDNILALIELNDLERRCGLPLTSREDYKPYGNTGASGAEQRAKYFDEKKHPRDEDGKFTFTGKNSIDKSEKNDIRQYRAKQLPNQQKYGKIEI